MNSMMTDFEEYIRQGEPDKKEKGGIWQTAIGLQQVDGLKPSAYLIETAKQNIEGDITFEEVKNRIDTYYKTQVTREDDDRTEEADKVSARIAEILSEKTFSFSPLAYINIHRRLFIGIYKFAGKIRDYNITKTEWVLNGKSVLYANAPEIRTTLDYDFNQEKQYDYKNTDFYQSIQHLVKFISGVWQIHAFGEGNTRTTAVFAIKYLRSYGLKIDNTPFAQHSWYFRNALVRANYNDWTNNIYASDEYLMKFFGNLLLGENNILKNRELHIHFVAPENVGVKQESVPVKDEKFLVNDSRFGGKFSGNNEMFPVKGIKFLVNKEKFPVIGLEILKLIENYPNITIIELSKQLNISDRAVKNNINKLREKGIIARIGSDKTGHWEIINNGGKGE